MTQGVQLVALRILARPTQHWSAPWPRRIPDGAWPPPRYLEAMASSTATTVQDYLDELPPDRAAVIRDVRDLVNASLPPGYQEGMLYGMITWSVPLDAYPDTYNGKPLAYVSLAAQKNHFALYLMGVYADSAEEARFREQWQSRGTRLDMGRSCLRFKRLEDLHADLVADVIAAVPRDEFVARARQAHARKR
jgi:hypothetical protein